MAAGLREWSLEGALALRATRQQLSGSLNSSQQKEGVSFVPWGNRKESELPNQHSFC